jgi:hypothetical protein
MVCVAWASTKVPNALGKEKGAKIAALTPATLASAPGAEASGCAASGSASVRPSEGRRILYIQTVRYKPEVSTVQIDQLLKSMEETLIKIPQIKSLRVGHIVDKTRQYDYAVVMEFDNLEDLHTYGNSEIHQGWVKEHNPVPLGAGHMTLTIQMDSGQ